MEQEQIRSILATEIADRAPQPRPGVEDRRLSQAIANTRSCLLNKQHEDGHWCAELEGDTILESEYILTMHFLGRTGDEKVRKAASYLRQRQLPAGGWALYPGGAPELSSSVKAYFVLKLVGDDPQAPHMERAREVILSLGGLDACNSFTKIYLSIFGQYEWSKSPGVPPELILFPKWYPFFNIYDMSSWSRAIVVPLSIIWAQKPHCPVPEHAAIHELRVRAPGRSCRIGAAPVSCTRAGRCSSALWTGSTSSSNRHTWCLCGDGRCGSVSSGSWSGWRKAMVWGRFSRPLSTPSSLCAAWATRKIIRRWSGRSASWRSSSWKKRRHCESSPASPPSGTRRCLSPPWPRATIPRLEGSSIEPSSGLWITKSGAPGDWRVRNPEGPVGGWYFEYANEFYPDCDDTAQILTALSKIDSPGGEAGWRLEAATKRALGWLLSMQNRDGGWASFDKGCNKEYLTYIPFADHNAMIDPSTTDITARALEALARHGHDLSTPEVRRAVDFVRRDQQADGSWYGRWGCNYLYGTWLALCGLEAVGEDLSQDYIHRAAGWIRSCQNPDGGWGELPDSYQDAAKKGQGPSTAAQTAWAIMGLIAAGDVEAEAVAHGVDYLLSTQQPGWRSWTDAWWTGTGFPEVFYLNYHYYAIYFPLLALETYKNRLQFLERTETGFVGPLSS